MNWRIRTEILRQQKIVPPDGETFEQKIRAALKAVDSQGLGVTHDGYDVKGYNGPVWKMTNYEKMRMASICYEHQLALTWLSGEEQNWDKVRVDT